MTSAESEPDGRRRPGPARPGYLVAAPGRLRRAARSQHLLIALVIIPLVVVGAILADDYGRSWDEYVHVVYATETIEIYEGSRSPEDTLLNLSSYGPFFSVVVEAAAGLVRGLPGGWTAADVRHFGYFAAFLLCAVCLYGLCLRFVSRAAALGAALLFIGQPVLFGHGFINPKDTPFMSFFLATICVGFYAVDVLRAGSELAWEPGADGRGGLRSSIRAAWLAAPRRTRVALILLAAILSLAVLETFVVHFWLEQARTLVQQAYLGRAPGPINSLFRAVAQDAATAPVEVYVEKVTHAYLRLRWLAAGIGAAACVWLLRKIFHQPVFRSSWWFGAVGLILGMCTAIRIQGLVAGLLVSVLALVRQGRRAIPQLALSWGVAALVLVLAWPSLWADPIGHLLRTLQLMSSFGWGGEVLYLGSVVRSFELPWHFIPVLIGLQLTLPALALTLGGWAAGARLLRDSGRLEGILIGVWFAAPVLYTMLPRLDVYDNFRQFLFVLPALFVGAGLGLEVLFRRVRRGWQQSVLLGILVVPGIVAIGRLHPYEYAYYNEIVGGTGGAYQEFELDYWCTSAREAMLELNRIAEPGAVVAINKDSDQLVPYAREDLEIVPSVYTEASALALNPDYLVVCSRSNLGWTFVEIAPVVFSVEREGVPLIVVRRLGN